MRVYVNGRSVKFKIIDGLVVLAELPQEGYKVTVIYGTQKIKPTKVDKDYYDADYEERLVNDDVPGCKG